MNLAYCTLFEKRHHLGVAALVNSLHGCGFEGDVFAGFRGERPAWFLPDRGGAMAVGGRLLLHLVPVEAERHLTNEKPLFFQRLLAGPASGRQLLYFDPDIVVRAGPEFFQRQTAAGAFFIADHFAPNLTPEHPHRRAWRAVAERLGLTVHHPDLTYVNAGHVALPEHATDFLARWSLVLDAVIRETQAADRLIVGSRLQALNWPDQDALNIALQTLLDAPAIWGRDGMDFGSFGFVMSHAAGNPKPWDRRYLREALQRKPPTVADKMYWLAAGQGPIRAEPASRCSWKLREMGLARLVGAPWRTDLRE